MDELALVLLSIRRSWREDPGYSASDLVYGTSLRIPGELFPDKTRNVQASSGFLRYLRDNMFSAVPPAQEQHDIISAYKPDTLASTSH